ncbi:MAG: response regulator transcription factor [Flavobacteriales bacterium]|nr:response regulator transcription factor [Flavobacteriales bacterium]
MIKVIIVDDEVDALVTIERFLTKFCPQITVIAKADNVQSAIEAIHTNEPDIVFLDINLQEGTGFDVLEKVDANKFKTIFTTAYSEFAIKAFEVKAFQYLLKPINPLKLQAAVNDVIEGVELVEKLKALNDIIASFPTEKIGLPVKDKITLTKIDDILRLESESNYTKVFLVNGKSVLVAKTLKVFDELLEDKSFERVHKSHMVNVNYISTFIKKENILTLSTGSEVPVSRRYKQSLLDTIGMKTV